MGSNLLSRGFMQIERRHGTVFKRVKSLLPRRESERRAHPFFRHCDILSAVETRISMLNMTYMKYIQNNVCCFIPGKVLDELDRVLNIVEQTSSPPKAHEILQELRDISSMAMEYFDEKILPNIKGQTNQMAQANSSIILPRGPRVVFVHPGLQDEVRKLTKTSKRQRAHINCLSKVIQKLYARVERQQTTIKSQETVIQEQISKMQEYDTKQEQHETLLADTKKQLDDLERKYSSLSAQVQSNNDIINALLPNPEHVSNARSVVQPLSRKTVIRPRISQVQTPNTYIVEMERKRKASIDADIPNKLRLIMKRDLQSFAIKEKFAKKLHENITQNISRLIMNATDAPMKTSDSGDVIVNTKTRKRRSTEDLDFLQMHFT